MVRRKGIVLVVVIGTMLVLLALAFVSIYLMTQQSRVAEHKIRRMRAYFAAQAGVIHSLEELRRGNALPASINIGGGLIGYGPGYTAVINRTAGAGPLGTDVISATVAY